jgi:hypothetical protein
LAGSSIIGALRVVLGADTAALDKGLDDSRTKLGQFASDIAATGAIIGAAITAAYGAVALGINNTLKSMDELNKQSQKIGIPVEQLSALKLAADLSDVSMEQLGVGVGKLSKNMVEAAGKPTSEAANAFRALGVNVKDANGKLLPTQDVLLSLADKFSGLKDGAGKTAAAMAIFGKSGADLIPLLNAGRDGIQGMIDNAQKFGVVIDGPTAAAAEKFRDTLTMLGAAKDGVIVKLTAFLLPALQQFADRMLAGASNADKQASKLSFLKTAFEGLARGMLLVADNFKIVLQLGAVFVAAQITSTVISMGIAFVGLARAIQATGIIMAAFEAVRSLSLKGILIMAGVVAIATGNFDTLKEKIGEIASYVATKVPDGAGVLSTALKGLGLDLSALTADLGKLKEGTDGAGKSQKDFNYQAMAGKTAVDQYLDSQNKSLAAQNAEIGGFGQAVGTAEALKIEYQALAIATANHTTISDAQRLKLDEVKMSASGLAMTMAGLQMTQSNLTPSQTYQLELQKIQLLFDNGRISAETYQQAMQKTAESAGTAWNVAGASMAGSFATIAASFGKEGSAMAKAAQVFGVIQGTISMYTGAAKALELPFPANIAAMAAVLAQGASLVAKIKSQSVPTGFKDGLSMTVPGGVGGGDSKMFQAMVEPGEQIDITPNRGGNAGASKGNSSGGPTIVMQGFMWGRDQVRDMFEALNEGMRDGHKLNVQFTG